MFEEISEFEESDYLSDDSDISENIIRSEEVLACSICLSVIGTIHLLSVLCSQTFAVTCQTFGSTTGESTAITFCEVYLDKEGKLETLYPLLRFVDAGTEI